MIQEKPYAYLKRVSASPLEYAAYIGVNLPANYKIGTIKNPQSVGPTPPPEEYSITVLLTADSSSPTPNYVDSAQINFLPAATDTYVRIYLVDDTAQGQGATVGTVSVRLQDAD